MKELSYSTKRAWDYVVDNSLYDEVHATIKLFGVDIGTACEMVYDAHTLPLEEYLANYAD